MDSAAVMGDPYMWTTLMRDTDPVLYYRATVMGDPYVVGYADESYIPCATLMGGILQCYRDV